MIERKSYKVIGVVGPCGSGKTTLVVKLRSQGFQVKHIAQEHSYVASMWQKIGHPDCLLFLDASYLITVQRRNLDWTMAEYLEQQRRLTHARQFSDLYIITDYLMPVEVHQIVVCFLKEWSILPELVETNSHVSSLRLL